MRRNLAALIVLADLSAAAHAESDATAPAAAVASTPAELFVELVVNGEPKDTLAHVVQDHDHLWIAPAVLRDAGIAVTGSTRLDLMSAQAFHATYDAAGQQLLLDVPPALLPTRRISGPDAARIVSSVDTGALLNYDLYLQTGQRHTTAALLTEQRVFGAFGTISNSGVLRSGFSGRNGYLRYDTHYHRVFEDDATEFTAGDLITRALPWTTAVRMGGVQFARNFAVRPDLVTVPLPRFAGEASVPSGVDLFVNGYRQTSGNVQPGRFVLDNVPVVNGAGEARVVTTDAVGRQIATVIPFYVAPELLRSGLSDFAVEAGFLRHGFGISNFGYGKPGASASLRHGLTQTVTLSAHAEVASGLAGAGVGAAWRLGLWGAVHASFAASSRSGQAGTQVTTGYSYASQRFSIGAEHVARSGDFADLGSFDLRQLAGSARSDRVSGSVIVQGIGSVGAGFIATHSQGGTRARLASASLSLPVGRRASAFAAIDYDIDRHRPSAQLRVIVPLGHGTTVASGGVALQPGGSTRWNGAMGRAVPLDGGFGYAADGAVDSDGALIGQANANWRGRNVAVEIGAATNGSTSTAWTGATGSLVLIGRRLFASNALADAFALVSTGTPDVPVSFENQRLGRTDGHGDLFVPSVAAYHASRFAIDPTALPIGAVAAAVERRAALQPGAGAIIRLPVRSVRSVTAHLVDAHGAPLLAGTLAKVTGGGTVPIGWDGVVLLEGPAEQVTLTARTAAGACQAHLAISRAAIALADLGAVRCE